VFCQEAKIRCSLGDGIGFERRHIAEDGHFPDGHWGVCKPPNHVPDVWKRWSVEWDGGSRFRVGILDREVKLVSAGHVVWLPIRVENSLDVGDDDAVVDHGFVDQHGRDAVRQVRDKVHSSR